jgi:hypothetical protein
MRDEALDKQIYERMNLLETDKLTDIWAKNDRLEWSDLTFEVIKEILQGRSVALPPQNDPAQEHPSPKKDPNQLKEFFGIAADADRLPLSGESGPIFYKPQKVIALQNWINLAMIATIVACIADYILFFPGIRSTVSAFFAPSVRSNFIVVSMASIVAVSAIVLQIAITVAALKGLSYILKILMQFEFNSRAGNMKSTEPSGEN